MSSLIPFQFGDRPIRVITDENGDALFVGKDVCEALSYADSTTAMRSHCRGVQKLHPIPDARGRMQDTRVLTEPDVLRLIVNCSLAAAEAFERWVFEEVLPTIRRTGSYTAPSVLAVSRVDGVIQALKLAPLAMRAARAFGLDKNVAAISANQYVCTVTGHNLLKEFGATHLPAENQETQWFTPTQLSAEAKMSAQKFNAALAAAGLQQRRGKVWELLPAGQAHARLIDTGKRHNSGAMVQQIRWSPAVLDRLLPRSSSQGNLV